jgi:hypothetical protein
MIVWLPSYPYPAVQLGVISFFVVLLAGELVLVVRDMSWGRWRWSLLTAVLLASVLSEASLAGDQVGQSRDLMVGMVGWLVVVLLFDRPFSLVAGVLIAHSGFVVAMVIASGRGDRISLAGHAVSLIAITGFQLCVATVAGALRRVSAGAAKAAHAAERLHVAEAVARELHDDRQRRYAELSVTAGPVLHGLRDGLLDPAASEVRRRCAIEAARMRRLFAESDETDDALLHELRAGADVAERQGIEVRMSIRGQWPSIPRDIRRALTEAPLVVVATAQDQVRLTVAAAGDTVSVSAIGECAPFTVPHSGRPDVQVNSVANGAAVWVEAQWRRPSHASPSVEG